MLVLMEMVQVRIMRILVQKSWVTVPVAMPVSARIGRRMIVLVMDVVYVAVRKPALKSAMCAFEATLT